MDNFIYHNPTKLIFGKDTISKIGKEIASFNIKRVLLLAGSGSIKRNGVFNQTMMSLSEYGIEAIEHWGVKPNPNLEHTLEGIKLCHDNSIDAVLAVGGGSVIDEAKTIAAGFYIDNVWDAFERTENIKNALPIFTILTLSGTGSEMNPYAVLTNEKLKKKWNIGSPLLFPKTTILDPSVQSSLPWHQTINGGIDAISHTMEFYFAIREQEMASAIGESIIKTVIKSLDKLHIDGNDYVARANLAWAATLALNGIAGSSVPGEWSAHRIEHGISALYPEVAHGAGLAVVFPAWIEYTKDANPKQFARFASEIWGVQTIEEAISAMKEKFKSWGAPISLKDLEIPQESIANIANNASKLGLVGNLKSLGEKEMEEILHLSYE